MELQEAYDSIRAEDAALLAVSVDTVEQAREMRDLSGAAFPILSDADTTATQRFGVYDLLGDGVAAPSTFIFDRDMQLVSFHLGLDIGDRVPAETIIERLQTLRGAEG